MPLKDVLFSFNGRIPRSTYWIYNIAMGVIAGIIGVILGGIIGVAASASTDSDVVTGILLVGYCLIMIAMLAFVYPSLAISAKRAHDRNHSGWFVLIGLIPFVGGLWLLIELGFMAGTPGPNQYGADPTNQPVPSYGYQ